jgi:hypothetical protein
MFSFVLRCAIILPMHRASRRKRFRVFFLVVCVATRFSPPFFGWRDRDDVRRRLDAIWGLLGESGYSPLGVMRSTTHAF